MKADIVNESGLIPSNANFKDVALDIVNNIESWRTDSQAKTNAMFSRIVANMNKKDAERVKYLAERDDETKESDRGYNLGHGRQTGD